MPVHFPSVKATFIHVPKTGGTSFYNWLQDNMEDYIQVDMNSYENGSIDGATKLWGDLGTVFSFVRNPYSRLVSMYTYQYAKAKAQILNPGNLPKYMTVSDYLKIISVSQKGFDYWLQCICNDSDEIYKVSDASPDQITVSSWFNGSLPDIIIKTENLNDEFYKIQNLLTNGQCKVPLPWANTSDHKPYREYYTEETRKLVERKFADDLNNFGYDF